MFFIIKYICKNVKHLTIMRNVTNFDINNTKILINFKNFIQNLNFLKNN